MSEKDTARRLSDAIMTDFARELLSVQPMPVNCFFRLLEKGNNEELMEDWNYWKKKFPSPYKTIIAGGRDFDDYEFLKTKILQHHAFNISEIVSGAARGADSLGELFAREHNIPVKQFPADWKKHGKAAGPIRNRQMAEYADVLIAFWDGKSTGTKNMIDTMKAKGKKVTIYTTGENDV